MSMTLVSGTGDFIVLTDERIYVDLLDEQLVELEEDPKYWHHEWVETEFYFKPSVVAAHFKARKWNYEHQRFGSEELEFMEAAYRQIGPANRKHIEMAFMQYIERLDHYMGEACLEYDDYDMNMLKHELQEILG